MAKTKWKDRFTASRELKAKRWEISKETDDVDNVDKINSIDITGGVNGVNSVEKDSIASIETEPDVVVWWTEAGMYVDPSRVWDVVVPDAVSQIAGTQTQTTNAVQTAQPTNVAQPVTRQIPQPIKQVKENLFVNHLTKGVNINKKTSVPSRRVARTRIDQWVSGYVF